MPKNIVVFIDGTGNEPLRGKRSRPITNVRTLLEFSVESPSQETKYLAGVATDRVFGLPRIGYNLVAGMSGVGISNRIKAAYRWLCSRYNPNDRVYLFGFSRGAFAVRSLAGFVDKVGLLLKEKAKQKYVRQAFDLYMGEPVWREKRLRKFLYDMTGREEPSLEGNTVLPIYFIGVWDSVAALGLPRPFRPFSDPFNAFHYTELPENVTHARHALALHELRADFEPLLWKRTSHSGQSLRQMWFPGAHSDVGGSYPEKWWSDTARDWIVAEATDKGLQLKNDLPPPSGSVAEPIHHQIEGVFAKCTPTSRVALEQRHSLDQATTDTFEVHRIVCDRLMAGAMKGYNFSAQIDSELQKIDQLTLQLAIEVSFKSVGRPFPNQEWWSALRVTDLEGSGRVLNEFLNDGREPSSEQAEAFIRAICLQVLFGEPPPLSSFLTKTINRSREKLRMAIDDASDAMKDATNQWAKRFGAVPTCLQQSVGLVPPHYQSAVADVREKASSAWQDFIGSWHVTLLRRRFMEP